MRLTQLTNRYKKKATPTVTHFYKHWKAYFGGTYAFFALWIIHTKLVGIDNPQYSGIEAINEGFFDIFLNPFAIFPLPRGWFSTLAILTVIFAILTILLMIDLKLREHYDPNTVQGDAQWMKDLDEYNEKYTEPFGSSDKSGKNNMILSQEIFMSMNNKKTNRNMNVFVIGGSGSGKSFNFVGPNIMQANCSYAVTDPSGGLYKEYGPFLEYYGYKIKCFNLSHMEKSSHYNPFNYIHNDKDISILVTTLISNTNPPDKQGGDPFWEKSETALLNALIAYLHHYTEPEMQNFSNVMRLMMAAEVDENDSSAKSPLDFIFEEVLRQDPESYAAKQYGLFKMGAGKTLKSILISCGVRLGAFQLSDVAYLTDTDTIDLDSLGDEKTGLFIILPTGEKTFNFLASMMYSQLFQRVYDYCENTAEYSQLIVDAEDQVVKTYRANSSEESEEKAIEAREYFKRACNGKIIYNSDFKWWEVRTEEGELVFYRGTEELAIKALNLLRQGRVKANSEQSNHGQRLPIHLRLLLDEFANIGKIPEFEQKVATIRKYEISVSIILQSLTQMKNLYEKNWGEISGNCDTTIYLGGGADSETTKWISELLGKETRVVMNESFGKSGSVSMNRQGVELFTPAQLRTMDETECIVLIKSTYAYKGPKYRAIDHPERGLLESLEPYRFDNKKLEYLRQFENGINEDYVMDEDPEDVHGQVEEVTEETQVVQNEREEEKRQLAVEQRNNQDIDGNNIIDKPNPLNADEGQENFSEKVSSKNATTIDSTFSKGVRVDSIENMVGDNSYGWGADELHFSSTEADMADANNGYI